MKKFLLTLLCLGVIGCSKPAVPEKTVDVLLIGGGIMSASLGTYLTELEPAWKIAVYERLDQVAEESSNAWNNAGTGHSAFCELNYTRLAEDGSIDIGKAVEINEQFELSKQFWAYQVEQGVLSNPPSFINNVPHMSFVWGDENIAFLHKRVAALQRSSLFRGMEITEDHEQIRKWAALLIEGRDPGQRVAATRMAIGTDVNFGEITRQLFASMTRNPNVKLHLGQEVRDIKRNDDGSWNVVVADLANAGREAAVKARFVFIGAGGGALKLLQKSGIPEAEGYAGFPVGGQFLMSDNPDLVARHQAKLYGKASVSAPPMSVLHLDTRMIDGRQVLLFGPFASFSIQYLKHGSLLDWFAALTTDNISPLLHAGLDNTELGTYLMGQSMLGFDERMAMLREYFPNAKGEDWKLLRAGQRVQVVRRDPMHGGVLQFGTEVVAAQDGSIVALLGASPGASTAAPIMLGVLEKAFKERIDTLAWQTKLKEILPSYGQKLNNDLELINKTREWSSARLQLLHVPVLPAPGI